MRKTATPCVYAVCILSADVLLVDRNQDVSQMYPRSVVLNFNVNTCIFGSLRHTARDVFRPEYCQIRQEGASFYQKRAASMRPHFNRCGTCTISLSSSTVCVMNDARYV